MAGLNYTPPGAPDYQPALLEPRSDDKHQASQNQKIVLRAQWNDYQKRFAPIEDQSIDQIGNNEYEAYQVANAVGAVDDAYAHPMQQYQDHLAAYGQTPDAGQMGQQERNYGLSRAAAEVQAANQTRQHVYNRGLAVAGGGLVPPQTNQGQK